MELKELLQILQRRSRLILVAFFLVFGGVAVSLLGMPKVYEASVKLYVQPLALADINTLTNTSVPVRGGDFDDHTYTEFMETTQHLTELIDTLDLKTYFGNKIKVKKLLKSQLFTGFFFPRPHISISHANETFIFVVEASSTDNEQAASMANTLASIIIRENKKMRLGMLQDAMAKLQGRIDAFREEYVAARKKLIETRIAEGLVDLDTELSSAISSYYTLMEMKFSAMEGLAKSKGSLSRLRQQLADSGSESIPSEAFSDRSSIEYLSNLIADLNSEMASALIEKTAKHPDVQQFKRQIQEMKTMLDKEVSMYRKTSPTMAELERDIDSYKQDLVELDEMIENMSKYLYTFPKKQIKLVEPDLRVDTMEGIYDDLVEAYRDLMTAEDIVDNEIQIVQAAMVPELDNPDRPRKLLVLFVGFILAMGFSLGLACVIDYLDSRVHSPEVLREAGIPVLGVIPPLRAMDKTPGAPPFRSIRNRVALALSDTDVKTLLFVSPLPQGGTSTIAANVARLMAGENRRVILVEIPAKYSFPWNVPNQAETLDWSAHVTADGGTPSLDVLSLKSEDRHTNEIPSGKALGQLLSQLADNYELVLVDAPALEDNDDPLTLRSVIDGLALVIRASRVPYDKALSAYELCEKSGINVLGVVFNHYRNKWFQ